jgi:Phytanoyl-CoA dioxygenase (PhyH)
MADGATKAAKTAEGPWFDLPDAAYAERATALSNRPDIVAAAAEYRDKGYLIRDFGFSDADLDASAAYTRAIKTPRIQDAWLVNSAIRNLAIDKRVITFLDELYQRKSFPFQTLNFPRGSQQRTHSDTFHFNSAPAGFMCGVWIALEDIHPDSGPLQYYPGSQRLPIFSVSDLNGRDTGAGYEDLIEETVQNASLKRETAPIRRGQAFIWAANLFHGGSPVADPARTRLSQVTHYYFKDCSYFTPLASDEPAGKVFWREPYDIADRRFVTNPDPKARPKLLSRLWERQKVWLRRPYAS